MTPQFGWTQPVCASCFAAIEVGRGNIPREPARVLGEPEPCMICAAPTSIYTRVDPRIASVFEHAKEKE